MNTRLKKIALVLAIAALPGAALAAPTITFQGEVSDQTCKVSVNGDTNSVVLLETVNLADFTANGAVGGETTFTVSVSDCERPSVNTPINVNFLGYDVDQNSGVMGNRAAEATAAKGFGIQLLDASGGGAVMLDGVTSVAGLELASGDDTASHDFAAQYYLIDSTIATAGAVTSVAEYTLSYF